MNVVTLVDFHDNLRDLDRKRGEVFVVSRERFEEINSIGMEKIGKPLVGAAEPEKQTPEARASKAGAKRTTRKKAE